MPDRNIVEIQLVAQIILVAGMPLGSELPHQLIFLAQYLANHPIVVEHGQRSLSKFSILLGDPPSRLRIVALLAVSIGSKPCGKSRSSRASSCARSAVLAAKTMRLRT